MAAVGVVTLVLTCGAVCQEASQSLPDAPSAQAAPVFRVFARQAHSASSFIQLNSFKFDGARVPDALRPDAFGSPDKKASAQKQPEAFFAKYLTAAPANKKTSALVSDSFMGRAAHAATGVFFTRDDSGRSKVNTSYFLRALTAVAADTASRPYWRRSPGEPLSDFGSTVGNDAGLNLLHEFAPGIQHAVKSHAPRFVGRIIGERLGHN